MRLSPAYWRTPFGIGRTALPVDASRQSPAWRRPEGLIFPARSDPRREQFHVVRGEADQTGATEVHRHVFLGDVGKVTALPNLGSHWFRASCREPRARANREPPSSPCRVRQESRNRRLPPAANAETAR